MARHGHGLGSVRSVAATVASAGRYVAASAAIGLALSTLVQAGRVRRAIRRDARDPSRGKPFERTEARPGTRILVLGDSTGVGIGADRPEDSIAGRIAGERAAIEVVNRSVANARVRDVLGVVQQMRRRRDGERFDVALLQAGGNDVLHGTALRALQADADRLLAELGLVATHIVWLGSANVGLAPMFLPPFSWWLSRRGRLARAVFSAAARRAGVPFLDFFRDRGTDLFSRDADRYYARDRVHPSSASYAFCYRALTERTPFLGWLDRVSATSAPASARDSRRSPAANPGPGTDAQNAGRLHGVRRETHSSLGIPAAE